LFAYDLLSVLGWTVLIEACTSNQDNILFVRWLLDEGAEVNLCMKTGWSPAHAASNAGNKKVLDLLLEKGAYKNKTASCRRINPNNKNITPIDVAKDDATRAVFEKVKRNDRGLFK
jgi:ankyrin repeat protein